MRRSQGCLKRGLASGLCSGTAAGAQPGRAQVSGFSAVAELWAKGLAGPRSTAGLVPLRD